MKKADQDLTDSQKAYLKLIGRKSFAESLRNNFAIISLLLTGVTLYQVNSAERVDTVIAVGLILSIIVAATSAKYTQSYKRAMIEAESLI